MADSRSGRPVAGGFILALAVLCGPVIGAFFGQASIGFLVGLGLGLAALFLVWFTDPARRG